MISFDIEKTPPTEKEIQQERADINKKQKNIRIKGTWLIIIFLLVAGISLAYGIVTIMTIASAAIFAIASVATLLEVIYITAYNEQTTREQLSMAPMEQEDCPEMLAMCQAHEKIRLYQNAVAAMRRKLTQGEFIAAKVWIEKAAAKESKTRQRQACATLASQV